jgi:translation initiation factor IF-3
VYTNKVKFLVKFTGRERMHMDLGMGLLNSIATALNTTGKIDSFPRSEGGTITMIMGPLKKPSTKQKVQDASS